MRYANMNYLHLYNKLVEEYVKPKPKVKGKFHCTVADKPNDMGELLLGLKELRVNHKKKTRRNHENN